VAESSPPSILYKFKAYGTSLDRIRVRRMLTRGEIYFSRAPEFNDPFEMRPRWVPRGRNSTELKKIFRAEVMKDAIGSRNQRRATAKKALENATPEKIRQNERAYHKVLKTKVDIFCMSSTRADLLMWAHYAESHTGLCIHIDATSMPFSAASAVHYSDGYPEISMPAEDPEESYKLCLLTKAKSWASEREYRLLHIRLPGCPSLDLEWQGPIAIVPLKIFTGVTLGARMPSSFRRSFLKLRDCAAHAFEVWVAKVSKTAFKLDFERLA
jgi:Protein of unknown function (DUF2971)